MKGFLGLAFGFLKVKKITNPLLNFDTHQMIKKIQMRRIQLRFPPLSITGSKHNFFLKEQYRFSI